MEYKLSRYEKYKDHDGNITSIFIAVTVTDDSNNSFYKEHWLTRDEFESVQKDEAYLQAIIEAVAAEGCVDLERYLATKPQPPEIVDIRQEKFAVSAEAVALKVESVRVERAERARIEAEGRIKIGDLEVVSPRIDEISR